MSDVRVYVGGADLTDSALFATMSLVQRCNGDSGEAFMRVRDDAQAYSFTEGQDWLVTVDGGACWRGFVTQVSRVYIAPAMDVAVPGTQRFWDLRGGDLNLLLSKRIVFNGSSPLEGGKAFPANTADTTAITALLARLDLSADAMDTTTGVTHVAEIDPEATYLGWSGWDFGQAMATIAQIPAAVYYLRPEAGFTTRSTLVYCDQETATAPYGLSDQPDGVTTFGYRDCEITEDATAMANDVLAVGYGYGSQAPVHKRLVASSSVTAHGLWQQGEVHPGVFQQATIDRIADSIVNGSPAHHRGAKDDRPTITCTVYTPGLLAGHVVDFASNVWGFTDTIPIRQSTITFESPTAPKWDLILSHEIDAPWQSTDPYAIGLPRLPPITVPIPPPPPPAVDPFPNLFMGTGSGQDVTDTTPNMSDQFDNKFHYFKYYVPPSSTTALDFELFDRPDDLNWGYSTDGHIWSMHILSGSGGSSEIVSLKGVQYVRPGAYLPDEIDDTTNDDGPWSAVDWKLDWVWDSDWSITDAATRRYWLVISIQDSVSGWRWWVRVEWDGTGQGEITDSGGGSAPVTILPIGNTGEIIFHNGGDGGSTWTITVNGVTIVHSVPWLPPGDCPCGVTDSFTRTVAATTHTTSGSTTGAYIGTADCGETWSVELANGGVSAEVNGSSLVLTSFPVGTGVSGVGAGGARAALPVPAQRVDASNTRSLSFSLGALPAPTAGKVSYDSMLVYAGLLGDVPTGCAVGIGNSANSGGGTTSFIGDPLGTQTPIPNSWWSTAATYTVTATTDGERDAWAISDGATSYSVVITSVVTEIVDPYITVSRVYGIPTVTGDVSFLPTIAVTLDDLDIPEANSCSLSRWDSFNRTVAPTGLGHADAGGLWTVTESAHSGLIAAHASVTPGAALLTEWSGSTISGSPTQSNVQASLDVSAVPTPCDMLVVWSADAVFDATNWIGGSAGFPDPHDNISMGDWRQNPPSQLFTIEMVTDGGPIGMATAMDATNGAHWGARLYNSTNFDYVDPSTLTTYTFTPGQQYAFRMHVEEGIQMYKMWAWQTDPEPGWQQTTAYTGIGALSHLFAVPQRETLFLGSSAPAVSFFLDLVDFSYSGRPCYWAGGVAVDPGPSPVPTHVGQPPATGASGYGCEVAARTSSTAYATSVKFVGGATMAFIDGMLQRRGTDYTEDADSHGVTFTSAVASTSTVTICYYRALLP